MFTILARWDILLCYLHKFCYQLVDVIYGSTFRTTLVLPSIVRRIEDFLIVQELNIKVFNHAVHEDLLFTVISTPSAGYEVDYERLELSGLLPHSRLTAALTLAKKLTQHFVGIEIDS